jgi:hypothetical protein
MNKSIVRTNRAIISFTGSARPSLILFGTTLRHQPEIHDLAWRRYPEYESDPVPPVCFSVITRMLP